jgi:hypothetical protein
MYKSLLGSCQYASPSRESSNELAFYEVLRPIRKGNVSDQNDVLGIVLGKLDQTSVAPTNQSIKLLFSVRSGLL